MKEQYQETYENQTCPKNNKKATHTVWFAKSSCTRFSDDPLDFSCSLDTECKACMDEYP